MKTAISIALVAVSALAATTLGATAASITNADGEPRVVTLTIDGVRTEQSIAAGARIDVCEKGCFVLFPSGDILPLTGSETVVIQNGAGKVNTN